MNCQIGVIGGVLLDLRLMPPPPGGDVIDRPIELRASIGGVGFNVAKNLAGLGADCVFVSTLRRGSVISGAIMEELKNSSCVGLEIMQSDVVREAVHVNFSELKGLDTFASSSPLDDPPEEVCNAILECAANFEELVFDTNLPPHLLFPLQNAADERRARVSLVSASDAKAERLRGLPNQKERRRLVGLNLAELARLGLGGLLEIRDPSLRDQFFCDVLLVTGGQSGAVIQDERGFFDIPPPGGLVVDTTGAGDAMFSAVLRCLLGDQSLRSTSAVARIRNFVADCLQREGA